MKFHGFHQVHGVRFASTDNFTRPFARRAAITLRPVFVAILARNPCVRSRFFQRLFANIFSKFSPDCRRRIPVRDFLSSFEWRLCFLVLLVFLVFGSTAGA